MQLGIDSFAAAYLDQSRAVSPSDRLRDLVDEIAHADEVTEKILRHSDALGGLSRVTFQMNAASLPHAKLMQAIELLGTRVAPALRKGQGAPGSPGRA